MDHLLLFTPQVILTAYPPNGNNQIYLYDVASGIITPITNETTGGSNDPSINGLGTQIAFVSDADINGLNPGGDRQVFLFNINTSVFDIVTNGTGFILLDPASNTDGNRIAFTSSSDYTGQNPSGFRQVFLYDGNTDDISQITMATTTTTSSTSFAINGSGSVIAFSSDGDPNGGILPGGQTQAFLFDSSSFSFEQITSSPDQGAFSPAIGQDGSCVVFASRIDITGENPEEEVKTFLYDISSATFEQVGNPPGRQSNPATNADCTTITFQSRVNNVEQVFVATCFDPNAASNVPTLSEWGLIAMASILGIVGFMVMRRRKVAA
jgi:Tol biopolymer transport system component